MDIIVPGLVIRARRCQGFGDGLRRLRLAFDVAEGLVVGQEGAGQGPGVGEPQVDAAVVGDGREAGPRGQVVQQGREQHQGDGESEGQGWALGPPAGAYSQRATATWSHSAITVTVMGEWGGATYLTLLL